MRLHVDACLPMEACGVLAGLGDTVSAVIPVANAEHSTVRYRMEPREQLRAFNRIEADGLDLLGIFHSHPDGPPHPSPTDVAEAAYPVAYLIWWREAGLWRLAAFSIHQGRVSDVKLDVADGA